MITHSIYITEAALDGSSCQTTEIYYLTTEIHYFSHVTYPIHQVHNYIRLCEHRADKLSNKLDKLENGDILRPTKTNMPTGQNREFKTSSVIIQNIIMYNTFTHL